MYTLHVLEYKAVSQLGGGWVHLVALTRYPDTYFLSGVTTFAEWVLDCTYYAVLVEPLTLCAFPKKNYRVNKTSCLDAMPTDLASASSEIRQCPER